MAGGAALSGFRASRFEGSRLQGWAQRWRRRGAGASTAFGHSTLQEVVWQRAQGAARRLAMAGALLGGLLGLMAFAPAAWLALAVRQASADAVQLAQAEGSVWSGSAVLLLTAGPGSRDAAMLPGRLHWRLRPAWSGGPALRLTLTHPDVLAGYWPLLLRPGIGRFAIELPARPEAIGTWPMAWLDGLGTPWNTLQMRGALRASTPGLTLDWAAGRLSLSGSLQLDLIDARSRASTLPRLGTYRLRLAGDAAAGGTPTLSLSTQDGALLLDGRGDWNGPRLRFRGMARAAEGQDAALANLLNIIGRRQGASSLIVIG